MKQLLPIVLCGFVVIGCSPPGHTDSGKNSKQPIFNALFPSADSSDEEKEKCFVLELLCFSCPASVPSETIRLPGTASVGDLATAFDRAPQIRIRLAKDDTQERSLVLEFGAVSEHRVLKSGDLVLCVAVSTNQIKRILANSDEVGWTTNSVESIDPGRLRGVQIVADDNAKLADLLGLDFPVVFSPDDPCWILVGPDVSAESFPETLTEGGQTEWNQVVF